MYVSGISGNKEVSPSIFKLFFNLPGQAVSNFYSKQCLYLKFEPNSTLITYLQVKKRQQRVTMILDSKNVEYTVIDIAEPGRESDKEFMQENSKAKDSKHPLPPQIFNGDHYCGVIYVLVLFLL